MSLLTVATQSLQANQTALSVTGQNISNVNTEGYTRQAPVFLSREGLGGVSVDQIDRIADAFLNRQIWADSATYSSYDAFEDFANELDNLMASDVTSISKAMDDYFGALQTAVDDPVSLPNRELFIAQSEALAQRFNDLDANLRRQNDTINGRLESNVASINTISQNIAQLNDDIRIAKAAGSIPSELLDQRDAKLEELSTLIGFNTIEDGTTNEVSVFIGNGEPLVVGQRANTLSTITSPADASQLNLGIQIGNTVGDITEQVSGGRIGGILDYRSNTLSETLDELGRIALVFVDTMNSQHEKGMDLDGNAGGLMFTDVNSSSATANRVLAERDNLSLSNGNVIINDVSKIEATEYELVFSSDNSFTLIRGSDDARLSQNAFNVSGEAPASASDVDEDGEFYLDSATGDLTLRIDGFTLQLNSNTSFSEGDKFLIRPTRNAASEIGVVLNNARQLALGTPLATSEDAGNVGTGAVSVSITDKDYAAQSAVFNTVTPPIFAGLVASDEPTNTGTVALQITDSTRINNLSYPLSLTHTAGDYAIVDSTGTALTGSPFTPVAGVIDLTTQFGLSITVGGAPGVGEVSSIEYDSTSIDDNSLTPPLNVSFLPALQGVANTGNQVTTLPANLTADAGTSGLTIDSINITDAENVGSENYPLTFTHTGGSNYQVTDAGGAPLFVTTLAAGVFDMTAQVGFSVNVTGAAGAGAFTIEPADVNQIEYSPVFTASTGSPSGLGAVEARVTDTSLVNGANYPLTVTYASNGPDVYTVTDSQGTELLSAAPGSLDLTSLGLALDVTGTPVVGDTFTIQPETNTNGNADAQVTNVRITDDRLVGEVTYPLTVSYDAGATEYTVSDSEVPANILFRGPASATGALDMTQTFGFAIDMDPTQVPADGDTFIIQHDATSVDTKYVVLTDADGDRVLKEYKPGEAIALSGYEVMIENQPKVGDQFTITLNLDGVSDNRNALFLSDLQFAKLVEGASYQDKYGQTVERVGTEAAVAQVNAQAGKAVLDSNKEQRSSIAGVNLDEEAARLVQYQQAYQASAQLIRAAQTIFDTLLQSV